MPVPSLSSMAVRAATRRINDIDDIGDMPYSLAEPILRKIQRPAQLIAIQERSPEIADHTEPLWIEFIKRDVPQWEHDPVYPRNKRSWYKLYRKLVREDERAKDKDRADLAAAMSEIAKKRVDTQTRFIATALPDPDPKSRPKALALSEFKQDTRTPIQKEGSRIMNSVQKASSQAALARQRVMSRGAVTKLKLIDVSLKRHIPQQNDKALQRYCEGVIKNYYDVHGDDLERKREATKQGIITATANLAANRSSSSAQRPAAPRAASPTKSSPARTLSNPPPMKMSTIGASAATSPTNSPALKRPDYPSSRSSTAQADTPAPALKLPVRNSTPPSHTSTDPVLAKIAAGSTEPQQPEAGQTRPSSASVTFMRRRRAPVDPFMPSKRTKF